PGQETGHLKRIDDLTGEEESLARKLRQAGSRGVAAGWVELAEVRRSLPADGVLIDLAHFSPFDPKAAPGAGPWQGGRYAAWVTPRSGPVRLVDLGAAAKIDGAVQRFREALKEAGKQVEDHGEERAEQSLRRHLQALSRLLLEPLLPHVGKS